MSSPRYAWWGYVKAIIRQYPEMKKEYADLHQPSITANCTGMPGGGGVGRPTEAIAIRELPSTRQREYESVRRAIEVTAHKASGRERLKLMELVYWRKSHNLEGAARRIPCSEATAWRWHGDFIRLVARFLGLMDER